MPLKARHIVLSSLAVLCAILVIVIAWLATADLGFIRPHLERLVSERIGRELRIEGRLSIELGAESTAVAENVVLSDAGWTGEDAMLRVGRIELRLRPASLFGDVIEIGLVDIRDTQLHLARDDDGRNNWTFAVPQAEPKPGGDGEQTAKRVLIGNISVSDFDLALRSPERATLLQLSVHLLEQQKRADDFLHLAVDATAGDRRVHAKGRAGPWRALLAGKDVAFEFSAGIDTLQLQSSGRIDNLLAPLRPEIHLEASGPDIDHVARILGLGDHGNGDIRVSADLVPRPDGPLRLDASGKLGEAEFAANGSFSDLRHLDDVELAARASGPDLGYTLALFGIRSSLNAPFETAVNLIRHGQQIVIEDTSGTLGQTTFRLAASLPDLSTLQGGSLDLDVSGPDFAEFRALTGLPGAADGPFSVRSQLDVTEGREPLLSLSVELPLASLNALAAVGAGPRLAGTRADIRLRSDSLASIVGLYSPATVPARPVSLEGSVEIGSDSVVIVEPLEVRLGDVEALVTGEIALAPGLQGTDIGLWASGESLVDLLEEFALKAPVPSDAFTVSGRLLVDDSAVLLSDVEASLGDLELRSAGRLVPESGFAGSELRFELRGPSFEKLTRTAAGFDAAPGPFELTGALQLESGLLRLADLRLAREHGQAVLDLGIGLPFGRRYAEFGLNAKGTSLHSLVEQVADFEPRNSAYEMLAYGRVEGEQWSIDRVELGLGDARARAKGELTLGGRIRGGRLDISGNIPNLATLGRWRGRQLLDQSLSWNATVTGRNGALSADNILIKLDASDISGTARYVPGDVPSIALQLRSDSIVVKPLLQPGEDAAVPIAERGDGRLIPDMALPIDKLRGIEATVHLAVDELVRSNLHIRDMLVSANLRDGTLDVEAARFAAPAGHFEARARVEVVDDHATVEVHAIARDFALGLAEANRDLATRGRLDLNVLASGADLRALAASSNGAIMLDTRGGKTKSAAFLDRLYGDAITQILETINPFASEKGDTTLECAIFPLRILHGKLDSRPYAYISTSKLRITGQAAVNLANEKLELSVETQARKGLGLSAGEILNPFVKITGTLASPRLAMDQQGVLIRGGAAVATGGLTILAKMAKDRLTRSGDPCGDLAKEARKELAGQLPTLSADTLATLDADTADDSGASGD